MASTVFRRVVYGVATVTLVWLFMLAVASTPASAATRHPPQPSAPTGLSVWVGYADDIRANPVNFPTPWLGSANVNFVGSAGPWDAGAIMLRNPTSTVITVTNVTVDLQRPGPTFNLWGSSIAVPANGEAILTQSTQYDFDTSDVAPIEPCGTSAPATLDPPKISVTIGANTTDYIDSGHVLDTQGFDKVCQVPNESTQWTPIGSVPCSGSALRLAPAIQALAPGTKATETATFADSCGSSLPGVAVNFAVLSGPNAGQSGSGTTNAQGAVAFSYTGGTGQGIDRVQATITNTVGTIRSNTANVPFQPRNLYKQSKFHDADGRPSCAAMTRPSISSATAFKAHAKAPGIHGGGSRAAKPGRNRRV